MKRRGFFRLLTSVIIGLSFIITANSHTHALSAKLFITVKINGNIIKMDTPPYMKNFRTMVSVRFVAEALNAKVEWIGEERKVIIKDGEKTIELFAGSDIILVDGIEHQMDVKAEITNSRTMVPVRFIAENMDCTVEWDPLTYSVLIGKQGAAVPAAFIKDRGYTDEDILWLARIVSVEGRGLSIEAKVAIANVVLNRVTTSEYPDSIYNVIFDTNYAVQFPPAHKQGFRESIPTSYSVIAAKMSLEGINNIENCLYFNYKPFSWKDSNDLYRIIDGEYFYY